MIGDLSQDFHTFAVNWTPNEIIWYVDGAETFRSSRYLLRERMFMILDVEVGGPAGPPDSNPLGNATEVDYVRAFDNSRAFVYDGVVVTSEPTPKPTRPALPTDIPAPTRTPVPGDVVLVWAQTVSGSTNAPQPHWRIQVFDHDQLVAERDTDLRGWASLLVAPGQYRVCEVIAVGWRNTSPGEAGCYWLTLQAGDTPSLKFINVK